MIEIISALIVGLVIGAMLGYHFALDALLRFTTRQGGGTPLEPAVRSAIRAMKGKPQEAKFYPGMSDEELREQDGGAQEIIKRQIHPGARRKEDEE